MLRIKELLYIKIELPDPSIASFPILINFEFEIFKSEKSESIASEMTFLKTRFFKLIFFDRKKFT